MEHIVSTGDILFMGFLIMLLGFSIGMIVAREITNNRQIRKALSTESGDPKIEFINGREYYILTAKHFHRIKRRG